MGNNYFGGDQPNYLGNINERGGGLLSSSLYSPSSSRKGKKNVSDKPKQPQRGLGVAQLEKIRLHNQLGCAYLPSVHNNHYAPSNFIQEDIRLQTPHSSSSPSYSGFHGHHGVTMGLSDLDRANITYEDSQSGNLARWHQGNAGFGTQQYFVEPSMTASFFEPGIQGSLNKKKKKELMDLMGSSSQNSESSSAQDIDLELRLSL